MVLKTRLTVVVNCIATQLHGSEKTQGCTASLLNNNPVRGDHVGESFTMAVSENSAPLKAFGGFVC